MKNAPSVPRNSMIDMRAVCMLPCASARCFPVNTMLDSELIVVKNLRLFGEPIRPMTCHMSGHLLRVSHFRFLKPMF